LACIRVLPKLNPETNQIPSFRNRPFGLTVFGHVVYSKSVATTIYGVKPHMAKLTERKTPKSDAIYGITFYGTYWTHNPAEWKDYRVENVKFDQDMVNRGIQSVWKNELGPHMMRLQKNEDGSLKYRDFRRFRDRYYEPPIKISGRQISSNPDLMSREELLSYAEDWNDGEGMELELALYPTVNELRLAVKEYEEDPQGFISRQADIMSRKGERVNNTRDALALQGIELGDFAGIEVSLPGKGSTKLGKEAIEARDKELKEAKEGSRAGFVKKKRQTNDDEDF